MIRKNCKECGTGKNDTGLFCKPCRRARMQSRMKIVIVPCRACGKQVECKDGNHWRSSLTQAKSGRATCSEECTKEIVRRGHVVSGMSLAKYNQTQGRINKILNNPMKNPKWIAKMMDTKTKNGTLSVVTKNRGGNGRPVPIAQKTLADALKWRTEVPIKTASHLQKGSRREFLLEQNLPTCYKIDIANTKLMIGIEVDGQSHNGKRRILDSKKTEYLQKLGWKVLRFTNRQILNDLRTCVRSVLSSI